jgi:hypothetical protein
MECPPARAGTTDEAYWADYDVWEIEQVLDQQAPVVTGVPCGAWRHGAQLRRSAASRSACDERSCRADHEFTGLTTVGRGLWRRPERQPGGLLALDLAREGGRRALRSG